METIIIWFRRDLRIKHNPALNQAINSGLKILAIYINDPEEGNIWKTGSASKWWLHHSLNCLHKELSQQNIHLNFYQGETLAVLNKILLRYPIQSIFWHSRYEPFEQAIENKLKSLLQSNHIDYFTFNDRIIQKPHELLNQQGTPYRVFTAFYKKARAICPPIATIPVVKLKGKKTSIKDKQAQSLDSLNLLGRISWHHKFKQHWIPGELTARTSIKQFLNESIQSYPVQRDFPAVDLTSRISPHLHFGEVSIQGIFSYLNQLQEIEPKLNESINIFIRQLFWREFAAYLLWHFPDSTTNPMNPKFKMNFWQDNHHHYDLWAKGKTGIEIIDAGMQQLWQKGWMHNRVRMIIASFLTKNLGISWLSGAQWFWDTLVDADLANNTMGWQWVAGCGVDAAPYFRIFNPHRQAEKFDPKGQYIQTWLDETNKLKPIIDLKQSREEALLRYQTR